LGLRCRRPGDFAGAAAENREGDANKSRFHRVTVARGKRLLLPCMLRLPRDGCPPMPHLQAGDSAERRATALWPVLLCPLSLDRPWLLVGRQVRRSGDRGRKRRRGWRSAWRRARSPRSRR
jgi:hypothetical protein